MESITTEIFAHEILELVFSFCDPATLAAVGRVSLACLELSVPFLYAHVELRDKKTCELLFCESKPSSVRVHCQLSLAQVRTLAILYNPSGESLSSDRIPPECSQGIELEALKLVLKMPPKSDIVILPPGRYVPLGLEAVFLNAVLSLLNPRTFLFVTNVTGDTHRRQMCHGHWKSVGWTRTTHLIRAGITELSWLELINDRETIVVYAEPSIMLTRAFNRALTVRSYDQTRGAGSYKPLVAWVVAPPAEQSLLERVKYMVGIEAESRIGDILSIEVKPGGHEGWWAEQTARKRSSRLHLTEKAQ